MQRQLFTGGTAEFSACDRYRYHLTRDLAPRTFKHVKLAGEVAFVMLNPSTATADTNDPTIRRCIGFALDWGYARIHVLNIFALRSTDPRKLYEVSEDDAIGPDNDVTIFSMTLDCNLVVCAWGNHGALHRRGERVLPTLREAGRMPHALRITKAGHPEHPLYQRADSFPTPIGGNHG